METEWVFISVASVHPLFNAVLCVFLGEEGELEEGCLPEEEVEGGGVAPQAE